MMISARLINTTTDQTINLSTAGREHALAVPVRKGGCPGSSVNDGELLLLAVATCYCNDLYREAEKRGVIVDRVDVQVNGIFGGEGEPAQEISYTASVLAQASEAEISDLVNYVDGIAEIHKTLRRGSPVTLRHAVVQAE